jgi:hypothetical protein
LKRIILEQLAWMIISGKCSDFFIAMSQYKFMLSCQCKYIVPVMEWVNKIKYLQLFTVGKLRPAEESGPVQYSAVTSWDIKLLRPKISRLSSAPRGGARMAADLSSRAARPI